MPTNYVLKLYGGSGPHDENNNSLSKNDEERLIEYTPNQMIGQLSKHPLQKIVVNTNNRRKLLHSLLKIM